MSARVCFMKCNDVNILFLEDEQYRQYKMNSTDGQI